jgi:putrescine transport system substrate-binding protein
MAAKLARCGINMLDAPAGVVRLVLKYLGRNPDAPTAQDLAQVESVLLGVRPYIRTIDSTTGTQAMVNGDICIALSYSDDMTQARRRAREAGRDVHIGFVIPKEGSLVWYDLLAIPRDAPHVASAYAFINYLMDPEVIARITDYVGSANGNAAATRYLDPATAADPVIYPPPAAQTRLFLQSADSAEQSRAITRLWQKFKTAQ